MFTCMLFVNYWRAWIPAVLIALRAPPGRGEVPFSATGERDYNKLYKICNLSDASASYWAKAANTQTFMDDKQQVKQLFEQYHRPVFAYLYRLVNNQETASDLTQETFLNVMRHRQKFDTIENQRAWIYRIATNLAYSHLRRQRRFRWLPWHTQDLQQPAHDPVEKMARQQQIARALAALSPKYRVPLLLFTQFDFSVKEIAEMLNLTESNTKVRLHRARQMFRQAFEEEDAS